MPYPKEIATLILFSTMNYHWLKIKISIPVKFNGFWSYKNIFKQFEPKKLCKKKFSSLEKIKNQTPKFFCYLVNLQKFAYISVIIKFGTIRGPKMHGHIQYLQVLCRNLCLSPCHFLPFKFEVSATGSK